RNRAGSGPERAICRGEENARFGPEPLRFSDVGRVDPVPRYTARRSDARVSGKSTVRARAEAGHGWHGGRLRSDRPRARDELRAEAAPVDVAGGAAPLQERVPDAAGVAPSEP